jgi:hypothetical protein
MIKIEIKIEIKILLNNNRMNNLSEEPIIIPHIADYKIEIKEGTLVLTPKKKYITDYEMSKTSFSKSIIKECIIKDSNHIVISTTKTFGGILNDIWKTMPTEKILKTTNFNMKLINENGKKGYNWNKYINMSVQSKNANGCLKEILHMVKENNYSLYLCVLLKTSKIVYLKL